MRKCLLIFLFIFTFVFPASIGANTENQFITIVNPIRISTYNPKPLESLEAEYSIIRKRDLSATWLLTYDAIANEEIYSFTKKMDPKQELGIFLEVTPRFAQDSGIIFNDTGSWHHATSVFLSGYSQEARKLLIDTVFSKFKERFGYYPTSVGSWWTDSFSLDYMMNRYGVRANLGVADQNSTDGYQVWGQYWSTPFYPSKYHSGIPAADEENKLDIVTLQWAARDPLNGYYNSLYSIQDFPLTDERLKIDYFEKLINLYGKKNNNIFGQITVGLEADLDPEGYEIGFAERMSVIKKVQESGEFQIITMKDFADWYRKEFPKLSPPQKVTTKDPLGKNKEITWYQSSHYRIGVVYDEEKDETKIFDFRVYNQNITEPYFVSPNKEFTLSIYNPSLIDEVNDPQSVWTIKGKIEVDYKEDGFTIGKGISRIPKPITLSPAVKIQKDAGSIELVIIDNWYSSKDGIIFKDYSPEATHFFKQKRFVFYLLAGRGWQYFRKVDYLIPQGELDALFKLSALPPGKVIVYDSECLQCSYHTPIRPAAFGNKRNYVKVYGKHPIIYDRDIFNAETRQEGKKQLMRLRAGYIYLVKFEGYRESIPFSPGDLGVEKIFSNANAEIWKIK